MVKSRKDSSKISESEPMLALGMQQTREVSTLQAQNDPNEMVAQIETDRWGDNLVTSSASPPHAFTPDEMGQPDPTGIGAGSLQQEGQGNRQNDEMDELENVEPDIALDEID